MSMVTFEKPAKRVALPDWHATTWEMRQTADAQQSDSFNLRAEGRQLRSETDLKTKWDSYHNDARLHDRVTEVFRWQEVLEQCLLSVKNETAKLREEKAATERELESLAVHLNTVADCIRQRDRRYGSDLVLMDKGDVQLKNELGVIEHVKELFTGMCHNAWVQLNKLREVQFKLQLDIDNKKDAVAIDRGNLETTKDSAGTSYMPDPLRKSKSCIAYEAWLEHARNNKLQADNEMSASGQLREALYCSREKARNDLRAQHDATDYGLRRRIYETQRQKNELQWQRQKMMNEMEKLLKEVADLEQALMDKTNPAKLAETRLENRMFRPAPELVQDEVQLGLTDEVLQLRQTHQDLIRQIEDGKRVGVCVEFYTQLPMKMEQTECSETSPYKIQTSGNYPEESIHNVIVSKQDRGTYNALEAHLIRLDQHLTNKQHTLMTDLHCLDMRDTLKTGKMAPPATETDRNIQLTKMEEELAKP